MSHFSGFVILTPGYAKSHNMDESLEKYSENLKVPEYCCGPVSNIDKVHFLLYNIGNNDEYGKRRDYFEDKLYDYLLKIGKIEPMPQDSNKKYQYIRDALTSEERNDAYIVVLNETYPGLIDKFDAMYKEHGEGWNNNAWRFSYLSKQWEEYSRYNQNSKWDWYQVGGRWNECIKTKNGKFVNECKFGDIDLTDFTDDDYEKEPAKDIFGEEYRKLKDEVEWHHTISNMPFCIVIDGEWFERGKMGWFGISCDNNENWEKDANKLLENIPEDSDVYLVDFHI